jgi:hypothetical protein
MEPEEADHLQLCGKKSAEASQRAKLRWVSWFLSLTSRHKRHVFR